MKNITIPDKFNPRIYQTDALNQFNNGKRYGFLALHRRAGKDQIFLQMLAAAAMNRIGSYYYMLPYYAQRCFSAGAAFCTPLQKPCWVILLIR